MSTSRFVALVALCAASSVASPAWAQAGTPSVSELRAEARSLLQSMCGWQCDVVDVRIKPKSVAPTGAVAPGFDDTPAARTVAGAVDVTLLLDAALAPSLRAFVVERVRTRLTEMGLPVTVTEKVVAFPPRPSVAPVDPPPPAATAPPASPPTIVIPPAPPAPPPPAPVLPPKEPALERLVDRLIEAIPLLLLALLLAWTVLKVLSRYEALLTAPEPEPAEPPRPAPVEAAAPPPARAPDPDASVIQAALGARRGGTRRVFDRLLRAGEDELVARAVARFGPGILADLAADPAHAPALARAGRRAAEILRGEPGPDADREALRALDAELVADRVAYPTEPVPASIERVLALGPEGYAALADALGGRKRILLLKHGPADLTTAYVASRAPEERAACARELTVAPPASEDELVELARAIDALAPTASLAAGESERLADVIDVLPAAEQEALVTALSRARPELVRRAGGRLPVEGALLQVPEAALTRAFDAVSVATWATYLRGAPEAIRQRALAACPKRLSAALAEELALRVAVDPRAVALARRAVVRATLDASSGLGLASASPVAHAAPGGPAR